MKKTKNNAIRLRGESLTKEILFMVAVSPVIISSLFLPNATQILEPLIKWRNDWSKIRKQRIYEAIKRLNQKRLVELIEKNNETCIKISERGKSLLKTFDYDNLELSQTTIWDKKWRLIIFDISEKKKKERNAFSRKLKELGFYPLQESAFVYPYDCRDEIDFICEFLSIKKFVNYCLVEALDKKEGDLYKFFNLLD